MLHVSNEREARQDQQQLQSTRQQKKHTISVCPSTVTFLYNFNIYFIFNSQLFSYTRICCCKKLKVLTCKWFPTKKNQNQFCCLETFLNIRQTIAYFEQSRLCRCCVFSVAKATLELQMSVRLSVCPSQKPLSLSKSSLSAIMLIY